ncbi:MAG: exo-alpha-sialidase [Gemmatimonadaceae bacterium]|nr:exo-alpha-sialidase [Gemmatimonadaceae bacterium]MDQ3520699.1 exo-alpha-sialidase [Gemmatimonadota bacterium]
MASTKSAGVSRGDVLLLVGTTKGAFLFWSDASRRKWRMDGPHFRGESVYALAFDERGGRQRILAAPKSNHWGSVLRSSDDFGATWSAPDRQNVRFPAESGLALAQIWQIRPASDENPDVVYCGVEPAALFESRDAGDSWSVVSGLMAHEHRPQWQPGGGGLCLHTIVLDPTNDVRMLIAISTGGVYRTDDGGKSWKARNVGVRAEFLPDKYPEFGQCVHKVVHHPSRPGQLFLQNHWGLYRSDDWGDTWHDIANGVPSDFGFAMQMHPGEPGTVYIIPLESDEFRCVPEAKLRVYRTRNAGTSWEPLASGLPQSQAFETVLRDSLAADSLDPAGIYFGTRNGKLFASADDGENWREIAEGLPSIVCVKAAVIGAAAPASSSSQQQ